MGRRHGPHRRLSRATVVVVVLVLALYATSLHLLLDSSDAAFRGSSGTSSTLAASNSFKLTQVAGLTGCVSDAGTGGTCTNATAPFLNTFGVVVSPDNKHVYVTGGVTESQIVVFNRNSSTGALTESSCVSRTGAGGCATLSLLSRASGVVVSPNGAHVYVADRDADIVFAFSRNATSGALTLLTSQSPGGCMSETGNGGACTTITQLNGVRFMVMSSDGEFLYTASAHSDAVRVLHRDLSTGVVHEGGCWNDTGTGGCGDGRAMVYIDDIAISPDDKFVYASGQGSDSVVVFSRDPGHGELTQLAGVAGCVSNTGSGGECAVLPAGSLDIANGLVVSPDGRHVYVSAYGPNAVVAFSRNTTTGVLSQLAGAAACISTAVGSCTTGRLLRGPNYLSISADGQNVYVPANVNSNTGGAGNGIAVLDRNATTGALTQVSGGSGCWQEVGADGCADGRAMLEPIEATVAPDGKDVYMTGYTSGSVVVFGRTR